VLQLDSKASAQKKQVFFVGSSRKRQKKAAEKRKFGK
jgi:hypothetical protein